MKGFANTKKNTCKPNTPAAFLTSRCGKHTGFQNIRGIIMEENTRITNLSEQVMASHAELELP
ncbi:MAG: hypothetical protein SCH70_14790, partial [Candidatus Methanoperedens sp.]|nr:hypothetical protein [Candidatus Methanoperedens sp.]